MDLSVLESNDPAAYKAEALMKAASDKNRKEQKQAPTAQYTPSSIAAADSGQFHLYRKLRRHELDRLKEFEIETEQVSNYYVFSRKLFIYSFNFIFRKNKTKNFRKVNSRNYNY